MNVDNKQIFFRVISYLKPHKVMILLALLAMAVVAATETSIPALMKPLLDRGFTGQLDEKLWQIPAFLVGLAFIRGAAQFLSNYWLNRVINEVLLILREQMFTRLLKAPTEYFQRSTVANLINTVVFEVNNVLSILSSVAINLVRDSLTVVGLLGYLFYLNWRLTLVVMVIFPVIGLIVSSINRRLRSLGRKQQHFTSQLAYVVEESASGHKVVKLNNGYDYEMYRFTTMANQLKGFAMRASVAGGLNQPLTQLIASMALSLVLLIAIMQSTSQGTTVGEFAAFVTAMMLIISPLKHLADVNQPLQRGLIAAEMIFGLIDQEIEVEPEENTRHIETVKGKIEFKDLGFSYVQEDPNPDNEVREILRDINLTVQPGEVVAFVGPSGSGKTSLVNLVPRFYNPSTGIILLDDYPIQEYKLSELRKQIGFVSQDVILFNDTIAANIAYGAVHSSEIDRTRVMEAIQAANLVEMVKELPQGIDTEIGDNGNRLSGGQRQRMAIARAVYKNAPILILDEATSALDSESERQVQEALENLMQGRTTLVIAHRLSTIEHADRIAVLEHGRIVELGSHLELIQQGGLYASLHRLQFSSRAL
ncbi:MAG: lipid A export permease/ATP-binding protein MsbA [Betaproteobacteria bacterium]